MRDKGLLLLTAVLLTAPATLTGCRSISPGISHISSGCGEECGTSGSMCGSAACSAACGDCGTCPPARSNRQSPQKTHQPGFGLLGPLYSNPQLREGTACWPWQYMYNVTLAGSQFSNAVLGGDPDESFSSRLGRAERDGVAPVKYVVSPATDLLVGPNHCWNSVEEDESRKMELWAW